MGDGRGGGGRGEGGEGKRGYGTREAGETWPAGISMWLRRFTRYDEVFTTALYHAENSKPTRTLLIRARYRCGITDFLFPLPSNLVENSIVLSALRSM